MVMQFQKAKRAQAKLRLGLAGPSGSGKTYGALLLAKGLGGRVAVIDTEQGSASLYEDLLDYDVLRLEPPYRPERFIEAVRAAEAAGYDVVIIDSITHEWNGSGGCLELNDEIAKVKYRGNTWSAWSETTPRHRAFIDCLLASRCHIIATMRTKTETAQVDEGGRKSVKKLGTKTEQREGAEYEFTTVLDLIHDGHYATVSKDRSGLFTGRDPQPITPQTGAMLRQWLDCAAPAALSPVVVKESEPAVTPDRPATTDEIKLMFASAEGMGFPVIEIRALMAEMFGLTKSRDLLASQVVTLMREIQRIVEESKHG